MSPIDEERRRRFESHRLEGGTRPLGEFLPPEDDPSHAATLEELVCVDLELRFKAWAGTGTAPSLADYDQPGLDEPAIRERIEAECRLLARRFGPRQLVAGARLGTHVLKEVAGRGAFAEVWRAFDEKLRREVALKIPLAGLSEESTALDRVMREARSAGQLRHPRIVAVHEVGTHEGRPYIVSEFVPGPTLTAEIAGRRFTPEEAARLVADVAGAAHYAHECGVVHRDLKPGNILLAAGGRPMLADFGLATLEAAGRRLTRHGDVIGTPDYMSPEQARGETASVDARSDVYALGAILYELVTGTRPFAGGSTASTLYAVVHRDPSPPRTIRKAVPVDLETICLKAMAKEADRRYVSAAELEADLRRFLDRRPVQARRRGPVGRLRLWARRNPALAATLAVSLLVVGAVAAVGVTSVVKERNRFRGERDRARENLYRSLVGEAEALLAAREAGWHPRAMASLDQAARLQVGERDARALRDLVIRCESVKEPSFAPIATWSPRFGKPRAVVFSPDGGLVAGSTHDDVVWLREVESGNVRWSRELPGWSLAWHPTRPELAVGSGDGRIWFLDPATGGTTRERAADGDPVYDLAWSPTGEVLAVGRKVGAIQLLGESERSLPGHEGGTLCLAFSPDGRHLVSGGMDGRVEVRDSRNGREVAATRHHDPVRSVGFTAGGDWVIYAPWETFSFVLLAVRGGEKRETFETAHEAAVRRVFAAPDGMVVTASADGSLRKWTRDLEPVAVARTGFGPIRTAAGHEGRRFAAAHADGTVSLWSLARPDASRYFHTHHACAFVPGGDRLLMNAAVLDPETGATTGFATSPVTAMGVHPESGRLYVTREDDALLVFERDGGEPERITVSGGPTALAVDPGGRLAIGTRDGAILLGPPGALERVDLGYGAVLDLEFADEGLLVLAERGLVAFTPDRPATLLDEVVREEGQLAAAADRRAVSLPGGDILVTRGDASTIRLRGQSMEVTALALTADGRRLASADTSREVRIWEPDASTSPVARYEHPAPVSWLRFDPAGPSLAVGGPARTAVIDVATGRVIAEITGRGGPCGLFDPSRDALVIGSGGGSVTSVEVGRIERQRPRLGKPAGVRPRLTRDRTLLGGGHDHQVWGVAADPKGRWFATTGQAGAVLLWNARTRELERVLNEAGFTAWTCAFSPDGTVLAAGVGRRVLLFDLPGGTEPRVLEGHAELVLALAFHPERPLLVSAANEKGVRIWDPATGRALGALGTGSTSVRSLAFRPGGGVLAGAAGNGTVLVWDEITDGAEPTRTLVGHRAVASAVGWSGDGRLLATGDSAGEVILRDGATFDVLATLRAEIRLVRALCFDSTGRWLAAGCYYPDSVLWDLDALRTRLKAMGLDW